MEIEPGTVIDKFEVSRLLGAGAMAAVYLVHHRHLGAPYALKVLQIDRPNVAERLLIEGRVQAALRHPNVVGVTDVILVEGRPGLVLEYIEGPTLETFIQDYGPFEIDLIDQVGVAITRGLRAAHRAGHLHRDLKPANILMDWVDETWVPKIADFGLAKFLFGGMDDEMSVTRTGQIMGSPTFMAPEQLRDAKSVDERADVFALGACLYELCTGKRCFDGPDVVSVFARIASGAFVPMEDLRPDLPMRFRMAIAGALVVNPAHRIPDCDTLIAVWEGRQVFEANRLDVTQSVVSLLGDEVLSSASLTTMKVQRPEPARKRTWLRGLLGSAAALLLVGGGLVGGALLAVLLLVGLFNYGQPQSPADLPIDAVAGIPADEWPGVVDPSLQATDEPLGDTDEPVVDPGAPNGQVDEPMSDTDAPTQVESTKPGREVTSPPRVEDTPVKPAPRVEPNPAPVAEPYTPPVATDSPEEGPKGIPFGVFTSAVGRANVGPCFATAREQKSPLRSRMDFRVIIDSGKATDVKFIAAPEFNGSALESCVRAAVKKVSFGEGSSPLGMVHLYRTVP